jgi:multicomponent Na+:H+ antiporter subunit E
MQGGGTANAAVVRAAVFFVFWLSISGWSASNVAVGVAAALVSMWVSLVLLPATGAGFRFGAFWLFALSFLRGSLVSGFDVAWRALAPQIDLRPGFVTAPLRLPPGNARNAFCALASLLPGTLPVGINADFVLIHGLDVAQPIASDLAEQEMLFMRILGADAWR